jgi:hypothetical protein
LPFTPRPLQVDGKNCRIFKKVRALGAFASRPVPLSDSDVFFLRSIPPAI